MASNNEVKVTFKAMVKDFTKNMQSIKKETSLLRSELNLQQTQLRLNGTETQKYESVLNSLNKQYELSKQKTQETEKMLAKVKGTLGENSKEYQDYAIKLNNAKREEEHLANRIQQTAEKLEVARKAESERVSEIGKAKEAIKQLETEEQKLATASDTLSKKYEMEKTVLGSNVSETKKAKLEYDHLQQAKKLAGEQTDNLRKQLENAKTVYGANSQEVKILEGKLYDAVKAEQEIIVKSSELEKRVGTAFKRASSEVQEFGKNMQDSGKKVSDVGKDLSLKVTAPIVGFLGLASKTGIEFEASMSHVQAVSGATGAELGELEAVAKKLGETTVLSASDVSEAFGYMGQSGWTVEEMLGGIEGTLNLAIAGNLELAQATDIVSGTLAQYGLDASESARVSDVLAAAATSSATDVGEMGKALEYAGANANSAGMDIEQTAAMLAMLADSSIGGSQAGTTFNAMLSDMRKKSKEGNLAIGETSVAVYDAQGNMRSMGEIMADVSKATEGMTSKQKDAALGQIFGEQAIRGVNVALENGSDGYQKYEDAMYSANGVAEDMADVMSDNLEGTLKEIASQFEALQLKIYDALLPTLEILGSKISGVLDWFNKLSPEVVDNVVKIGMIVAVVGPLLVIIGQLISSIGAIISVLGVLMGPVGLIIAAIVAVVAQAVLWYKNFEKIEEKIGTVGMVLVGLYNPIIMITNAVKLFKRSQEDAIEPVDRFGDSVSENTQQALGSYFELADSSQVMLKEMAWGHQEITKESAEKLIEMNNQMNEQILEGMREKHAKEMEETKLHFENSKVLGEEREAEILQRMQEHNDKQIIQQTDVKNRINEIYETASKEKREITEAEFAEINTLNEQMNETAVRSLSENEVESKIILERMKEQSGNLTAIQASEVVQNSKKATDGAIDEANKQYDETLAWIIKQRDETGIITEEEAQKMINEAKKQREGVVSEAEERHKNVLDVAQKQAGEHVNKVNWETGEILTKWQLFKKNVGETWESIKNGTIEKVKGMRRSVTGAFVDAKKSVEDKVNSIKTGMIKGFTDAKNSVDNRFKEIKNSITEKIQGARDTVSKVISDIKGFFSNMKLSIPSIKLPKLPKPKISGKFSLTPPSVPKISWNAEGGIFTKPTIFSTATAGLQGVGEAGAEAIIPLKDSVLGKIGQMIANTMSVKGSGTNNIVINATVRNEQDIERLTTKVDKTLEKHSRREKAAWGGR